MSIRLNLPITSVLSLFLFSEPALAQGASTAQDLSASAAPLEIDVAKRAVVLIANNDNVGAGFIISSEGHIITALHVIQEKKDYLPHGITVQLHDDLHPRQMRAFFVDANHYYDLAILRMPDFKDVAYRDHERANHAPPFISLVDHSAAPPEDVYYIGHPRGCKPNDCFVHQRQAPKSHDEEGYILLTTQVESGFSGGPVLTPQGKAIGFLTRTGTWGGRALPIHRARDILWSVGIDVYPEFRDYKAEFDVLKDEIQRLHTALSSLRERLDWRVKVLSVPVSQTVRYDLPGQVAIFESKKEELYLAIQYEKIFTEQITPVGLHEVSLEFILHGNLQSAKSHNPNENPLIINNISVKEAQPASGGGRMSGAFIVANFGNYIAMAIDRHSRLGLGSFRAEDVREVRVGFRPVDNERKLYPPVSEFARLPWSS